MTRIKFCPLNGAMHKSQGKLIPATGTVMTNAARDSEGGQDDWRNASRPTLLLDPAVIGSNPNPNLNINPVAVL